MKVMTMRYLFILLALLSASCSSSLPSFKPYHLDVQQGNVVSSKMMLQLKPGMTKSQVRYVMGTPLLQDSFHQNRWDYIYQMNKGGQVVERRRVILEFQDDALKTVRGDVIPAGEPGAEGAALATVTDLKTVKSDKTLLAEDAKASWTDRFKFWADKDQDGKVIDKAEAKPELKPEVKAETPKKGWMDKLKFWEDDAKPELAAPTPVQAAKVEPAPAPVKAVEPEKLAEPEKTLEPTPAAEPAIPQPVVAESPKSELPELVKEAAQQETDLSSKTEPADENQAAVAKMVADWADAWRKKDVNAYLKFYSDKFQPEGISKKAWLEQRKQRVGAKSTAITLVLEKVSISLTDKKARVGFIQHYTSGKFSDHVSKVLDLENAKGAWLITKESAASGLPTPANDAPPALEYVKPRDVSADEKSEAMPEKMLKESAKQAQQAAPKALEVKAAAKPAEVKSVEVKPAEPVAPAKVEAEKAPVSKKDMPLPPEDAPGYFERMLEKIGF